MKKTIVLLCALLIPVIARAKEYTVFDMTLTFDDSKYEVLTLDNLENSKYLKDLGISPSDVKKEFEKNDVYLDAIDQSNTSSYSEYVLTVEDAYFNGNLKDYSDSEAKRKMISYKESLSNLFEDGIYKTKDNKFYYLDYKYGVSYNITYFTVINSKLYTLSFINEKNEISEEQRKEIKNVLDTIKYTNLSSSSDVFNSEDSLTDIVMIILIFAIGTLFIILVGKFILPKNKKNVI